MESKFSSTMMLLARPRMRVGKSSAKIISGMGPTPSDKAIVKATADPNDKMGPLASLTSNKNRDENPAMATVQPANEISSSGRLPNLSINNIERMVKPICNNILMVL